MSHVGHATGHVLSASAADLLQSEWSLTVFLAIS